MAVGRGQVKNDKVRSGCQSARGKSRETLEFRDQLQCLRGVESLRKKPTVSAVVTD